MLCLICYCIPLRERCVCQHVCYWPTCAHKHLSWCIWLSCYYSVLRLYHMLICSYKFLSLLFPQLGHFDALQSHTEAMLHNHFSLSTSETAFVLMQPNQCFFLTILVGLLHFQAKESVFVSDFIFSAFCVAYNHLMACEVGEFDGQVYHGWTYVGGDDTVTSISTVEATKRTRITWHFKYTQRLKWKEQHGKTDEIKADLANI